MKKKVKIVCGRAIEGDVEGDVEGDEGRGQKIFLFLLFFFFKAYVTVHPYIPVEFFFSFCVVSRKRRKKLKYQDVNDAIRKAHVRGDGNIGVHSDSIFMCFSRGHGT